MHEAPEFEGLEPRRIRGGVTDAGENAGDPVAIAKATTASETADSFVIA